MATRRERVQYEFTATDQASQVFRRVETSAQGLSRAYAQVASAITLVASGGFVAAVTRAVVEGEQSQNRLTAALRATGNQVGLTRRQLEELAESLSESTQFDDEGIRNAQAQLVKFGNIHGEVFRGALKLSADLASFLGTDVASAAQQVGRALQSPTEGISLLERTIGKLTESEESHIRSLAAQGRAVEAQNAVLEVLEKRIGGTAELMNTGLTKATSDLSKAWSELLETIGSQGTVLNRTLGGAAELLKDVRKEIEGTRTPLRDLAEDSLGWVATLQRLPSIFGAIGTAARAGQNVFRANREASAPATRNAQLDQIAAFEASLANVPLVPVTLGGKTDDQENARRRQQEAERLRREQAQTSSQFAASLQAQQDILDEASELGVKFLIEQDKKRLELAKALAEEQQRVRDNWVESAQIATDIAEDMIYTWDAAGNRIQITREEFDALKDSERSAQEAARDLGLIFAVGFEDAIVGGEKFRDVLDAIVKDIARLFIRRAVTEPAVKFLGDLFAGMFEGKAAGGPVGAGIPYIVGERGPELFVPSTSGQIVPGGAGGVVLHQTNYFGSGMDEARLAPLLRANREQTKAEINDSLRRGSMRFATP